MGNELHVNNTGILREDTDLGKYIKDFLVNKHTFGDNVDDDKFKNYLKKRACCTKQSVIPISLPMYDIRKQKIYSNFL